MNGSECLLVFVLRSVIKSFTLTTAQNIIYGDEDGIGEGDILYVIMLHGYIICRSRRKCLRCRTMQNLPHTAYVPDQ